MRILLVTNHFYPETFRANDIAFHLASKGHSLSVLTGIPDYPEGRFHDGYSIFRKRTESVKGVRVHRSFLIPRGRGGKWRLALNYVSSFVCMSLRAVFLALFHRYDAVLVHETSPVMVGTPARIVASLQHIPMYFWVLDLWPESLSAAGGISSPRILAFFSRLTRRYYRASETILISSQGFRESICRLGDFADRIVYFPNWSDTALNASDVQHSDLSVASETDASVPGTPVPSEVSATHSVASEGALSTSCNAVASESDASVPGQPVPSEAVDALCASCKPAPDTLHDGFVVMFAGNVGEAQDFENIARAALALKDSPHIHFVIVGDGRKLQWLKDFVARNSLTDSVRILGRHPVETMPFFFSQADVMLVSLKDEPVFSLTLPAKVQAYMEAGKPIVAMMNGEGARVIDEARCGRHVRAADSGALADAILEMSRLPEAELSLMGERAKDYCRSHFSFSSAVHTLETLLEGGI